MSTKFELEDLKERDC